MLKRKNKKISKYILSGSVLFLTLLVCVVIGSPRVVKVQAKIDNEQLVKHFQNINKTPSIKGLAYNYNGTELWGTSLLNKNTGVWVIDTKTGKELKRINLGGGGVEIIFSDDGSKAYVSQMETAKVFEIDAKTKEVLRTFKSGGTWTKYMVISPDGKKLFASNWISNNISVINLETGKFEKNIKTVKTPRGLYITKDGLNLYVAGFENGDIEKINLSNNQRNILIRTGGAMRHIIPDEEKEVLYISDMGRKSIWKISLKDDSAVKFATTDSNPNTIALSPDKKILYVSCRGVNNSKSYYLPGPTWGSILLFDTETGKMLDAIIGGNQPTALAISPDGAQLSFSDFLDKRIQMWNIPTYEELKSGNGGISGVYKKYLIKKKSP
jgi:YVTN family beta-propeller protein